MMRAPHSYQTAAIDALRKAIRPNGSALLAIATGGGKTFVANAVIAEHLASSRENRILWVTKDWWLLDQALEALKEDHANAAKHAARIGVPAAAGALSDCPEAADARLVYTTLHTLKSRFQNHKLNSLRPTLVVWDECHWADSQPLGRVVRDLARARSSALVGLTATPRSPEWSIFKHDPTYSMAFATLVDQGFLAKPEVFDVRTGMKWRPDWNSAGEVANRSLTKLATSAKRNKLIVDTFIASAQSFGKTLIFACNIQHAEKLAKLFQASGVACDVLHNEVDDRKRALDRFRSGAVRVLVNVAMLTHGIDIPSIRTVFLCRPTASDTLFMQMVGRGSRLDPKDATKASFNVVEFNDSVDLHGGRLATTTAHFGSPPAGPSTSTTKRGPRLTRHEFDPTQGALQVRKEAENPLSIHDLWYRQGQTFGVEIELTQDNWEALPETEFWAVAEKLRVVIARVVGSEWVCGQPSGYGGGKSDDVWNVERDGSCGWEITSRILQDEDGLRELADVCLALDAALTPLGLRVGHKTGLHVHLGWSKAAPRHLPRLLRLVRLFEPALGSLVAPSRLREFDGARYREGMPNEFARPVAWTFPAADLDQGPTGDALWELACRAASPKYSTFNVLPLDDKGTVEVRMHSGTTEIGKIAVWTSLWMQLLWEAEKGSREVPAMPDTRAIVPNGDVVALAAEWLPDRGILPRLHERRLQVAELWREHPDLADWVAFADSWSQPFEASSSARSGGGLQTLLPAFEKEAGYGPDAEVRGPLMSVLVALEREGVLRGLKFVKGHNGWGIVVGDRPDGNGPIVHVWGQRARLKLWIYRRRPLNAGATERPPAHVELDNPSKTQMERELRAIMVNQ